MARERWKTIPQTPAYQVSSLGRVRRHVRGRRGAKPGIIKPWVDSGGRPTVRLWANGKKIGFLVSRLVCAAFNGPPPFPGALAAHEDDVPSNNVFTNLRWTDHIGNMEDRRKLGTLDHGERNGAAKLTEGQVRRIRSSPLSGRKLAAELGVSPATVGRARNGTSWAHLP